MYADATKPWASGPGEILEHGLELLRADSDKNRRLAMISIDNAVELMIKTYLGLPKRVSGVSITRKEFQDIGETFPGLLDGLEKFAPDKLAGVDLGTIEWYHRLRNQLYHQGNGLTVERSKVEVYGQIAASLYESLFGLKLGLRISPRTELLGAFIVEWNKLAALLGKMADQGDPQHAGQRILYQNIDAAAKSGLLAPAEVAQLHQLRALRNQVVHGVVQGDVALSPEVVTDLRDLRRSLKKRMQPPSVASTS